MDQILLREAWDLMARGESFNAGNLKAYFWDSKFGESDIPPRAHLMPNNELSDLLIYIKNAKLPPRENMPSLIYVVASYGVPIVWVLSTGELIKTRMRHSVTTTKHVNLSVKMLQKFSMTLKGNSAF